MENPFRRKNVEVFDQDLNPIPQPDPDTDPIYVTHAEDPSLDEDELIMHTTIDPNSIEKDNE